MEIKLKPIEEQVIVITGATSGIGLATARLAARRGARVVLAARGKKDLKRVAHEIEKKHGGDVAYVVADVSKRDQVERIAKTAERAFGGFDTWINNAGVSIYGRLEETPLEDARRLFDVNYWGVVHGSLVAAERLRERGGAILNLGSVVSERALPLQGQYSASKHAIKGFTDALRVELEHEDAPISVTLVKPSSIDTPYTEHARNLLGEGEVPAVPPPVYAPRVVARTLLRCAERPTREITVGGGRMLEVLGHLAPRLADRYAGTAIFEQEKEQADGHARRRRRRDTLYEPRKGDVAERGDHDGHVMRTSAYTAARLHPMRTALFGAALGVGVAMLLRGDTMAGGGAHGRAHEHA
jgi:short-subunit dehydrogenase